MPKKLTYPFTAKSTAYLRAGQFWAVELGRFGYAGWYGCGRVLELDGDKRNFLAGLMNYCDTKPPTSESIAGHLLIKQTISHIRSIDGEILGYRSLEEDGLEPLIWLGQSSGNHYNPNHRPDLMRGLVVLREATVAEHKALLEKDLVRSWGGYVNGRIIEKLMVQKIGQHGY